MENCLKFYIHLFCRLLFAACIGHVVGFITRIGKTFPLFGKSCFSKETLSARQLYER